MTNIHSFSVEIAQQIGMEQAVMISHIAFWIRKNMANDKHFYDGETWTYNSTKAFAQLFPYWTVRQVERILNNLIEQGYIRKGNYCDNAYNRTLWYSLTETGKSICGFGEIHLRKHENGFTQTGKSSIYSDINSDINTKIKPDSKTAQAPQIVKSKVSGQGLCEKSADIEVEKTRSKEGCETRQHITDKNAEAHLVSKNGVLTSRHFVSKDGVLTSRHLVSKDGDLTSRHLVSKDGDLISRHLVSKDGDLTSHDKDEPKRDGWTEFEQFWNAYPNATRYQASFQLYQSLIFQKLLPPIAELLSILEKHKKGWDDPKYIPSSYNWLKDCRWSDKDKPGKKGAVNEYGVPFEMVERCTATEIMRYMEEHNLFDKIVGV